MIVRHPFVRCIALLLFLLSVRFATSAQDYAAIVHDYRFNVLYYGRGDIADWENSYNTAEKYFDHFDPVKREFYTVGVSREQYPPLNRLNTAAGIGVSLEKGDFASAFGNPVRALSRTYTSYNVFDSSGVSVIALGINPANTHDYEYRLVLDDSAIVKDWGAFTQFKKVPKTGYQYADLGRMSWPGHYVLVETRHRQSRLDAGSVILNWPARPSLYLADTRIYFKEDNPTGMNGFADLSLVRQKHATGKDSMTGVLQQLRLPGDKSYEFIILDLKQVQSTFTYKALLERERKGVLDTVPVLLYFNDIYLRVESRLFDQPGKYRLLVGNVHFFQTPAYAHWLLRVPFEILPAPVLARKWAIGQLLPYIGGLVALLLLAIFLFYRRNARRVRQLEQAQQLRQWKLRSLQHQLNPHFLFNALGAIQNLIGKREVQQASLYLDRFSALTRTVLETSERELISLEDELAMLQAYLEMEQLRTPFSFSIDVAAGVDATNTEIPGMLLQPYVENAVKHGVTGRPAGHVTLQVAREADTLIFTVSDNGPGMQDMVPRHGSTGKGLSLVKQRVALLNEMYEAPLISSAIHSSEAGTTVIIQLQHWLDKTSNNA